jgi:protein-L-isoaspartate(D-aspartate) O-methyltransferase
VAPARPEALHLVDELVAKGVIRTPAVKLAFQTVPRHLFVPEVPVWRAYQDEVVPLKWRGHELISSLSQPSIMAEMLELLELKPGLRVLEIGAGSGYNAALISDIVGRSGAVTSVEIDEEMADAARAHLAAAGIDSVNVIVADGFEGYPPAAPYDRIVATAAVRGIPHAWVEQMTPGARLVAPVEESSGQYVVAFDLVGGRPVRRRAVPCVFMPMRRPHAR